MTSEAVATIVMRGRDETSQTFDRTRRSMGQMEERVETTRRTSQGATAQFGGMARSLGTLAVGALGVSQVIGGITTAMTASAAAGAKASFVIGGMGPAAQKSLEAVQGGFADLGREFDTTESAALGVFTTLIRDGGGAEVTIDTLRGTMALARANGIEFGAAADIVAQALRGNMEPLKALTGELGLKSLNEAFVTAIRVAPQAATVFTTISGSLDRMYESLGKLEFGKLFGEIASGYAGFGNIGGGSAVGTAFRAQAIQQVQVDMNIQGTVVMNEDQRREFTRQLQELLDENNRRSGG